MHCKKIQSFDHHVGASDEQRRQVEAERAGSFEVHREVELAWQFDWQVGGLGALQDSVRVSGGAPEQVGHARAVGHEAAGRHVLLGLEHAHDPILRQKIDDPADMQLVKQIVAHQKHLSALPQHDGERRVEVGGAAELDADYPYPGRRSCELELGKNVEGSGVV
jgi:hypothetical protein